MSLENLDTLETKISHLINRFNQLLQEKKDHAKKVSILTDQLRVREEELIEMKKVVKNQSEIEENNRKFEEERELLKEKTLKILNTIKQVETVLDQSEDEPENPAAEQDTLVSHMMPTDDTSQP